MAMGVDKAIHVEVDAKSYETMQPLHVAKIISKIAQENNIDLVLLGKQVRFFDIKLILKISNRSGLK